MLKLTVLPRLIAFTLIASLYFLWPNARPDFTRFNAHDSEAYLALAYSLANGLGYTRNIVADAYIPHTTWPPGLPILLLPAVKLGGDKVDWMLVKSTMILISLCGVVLTWYYVRRIADNLYIADAAAAFVALNPYYWHFARIAMAEVPVIVFCVGVLYLINLWWAHRNISLRQAILLGLIAGSGMLLKGVVVGLVLAPLAYMVRSRSLRMPLTHDLLAWGAYALAFAVPFALWALRNQLIDASNLGFDGINQFRMILASVPTDPMSPLRTFGQILWQAWDKIRWFIIYRVPEQVLPGIWTLGLDARPWGPYAAAGLTLLVGFLAIPWAVGTAPLYLVMIVMCCLNVVLAEGGSARYWISPMILLGIAIVVRWAKYWQRLPIGSGHRTLGSAMLMGALLINLGVYIRDLAEHPYGRDQPWKELAELFAGVEAAGYEADAVYTPNGSAFRLTTGLPAPMTNVALGIVPRYDHLVTRTDGSDKFHTGLDVLLEVRPWIFARLPTPLTEAEIRNATE